MTRSILSSFAKMKKLDPNFVDAWGNPAVVSDEHVGNLIKKMGYDAHNDKFLAECVKNENKQRWISYLPVVSTFKETSAYIFEVCLPIDFVEKN